MTLALYLTVFLIATCGLVYELAAAALASYLLGDTVTQFSTVIGVYLFAMGVGSYLSRFIERDLLGRFVRIELLVGLVGGSSVAALFVVFGQSGSVRAALYPLVGAVGILVGLEIPLLIRILKDRLELRDLVAHVLTFDYVGALAASLLFPLVLVPQLGLTASCFLFGCVNVAVGLWSIWLFRDFIRRPRRLALQGTAALAFLAAGFCLSGRLTTAVEGRIFGAEVIGAVSSPYQRIVVTRRDDDVRLYLNGHLQFSSEDEYRYHEALVHPGLAARPGARRALVLGGGDGLAVREILRHPNIESVTLVDLDPAVTGLFRDNEILSRLNGGSIRHPKVTVVNADAFHWVGEARDLFDFVVADFPDPSSYSVGKLYTTTFYRALARLLAPDGLAAVQATSPLSARQSYWCVVETIRAAGLRAVPYHAYVPSMDEWGFVLASRAPYERPERLPDGLRFLDEAGLRSIFEFPPDMRPLPVEPNRLDSQVLVRYYAGEWR